MTPDHPWTPGAWPSGVPVSGKELTNYTDEPGYAILPADAERLAKTERQD